MENKYIIILSYLSSDIGVFFCNIYIYSILFCLYEILVGFISVFKLYLLFIY